MPAPPAPPPPVVDVEDLEARARRLTDAWATVHRGLKRVYLGVIVLGPFCVPLLGIGSFVTPFVPEDQRGPIEKALWGLMFAPFVLSGLHVVALARCLRVPKSHGGQFAEAAFVLLLLCWVGAFGLRFLDRASLIAVVFVSMHCVAFAVWVTFLARLGACLGADDLKAAAWSFSLWVGFGGVQAAALLGASYLAEREGLAPAAGLLRLAAGVIALALLWRYAALLRVAGRAVARCAPVRSGP